MNWVLPGWPLSALSGKAQSSLSHPRHASAMTRVRSALGHVLRPGRAAQSTGRSDDNGPEPRTIRGAEVESGHRRLRAWVVGEPPFSRLVGTHALHAGAEAAFAVSLAGSLFFDVSPDAARPRVLLYLLLTMAPFAIVAPAIGPYIDRAPGGHRLVMVASAAGRGILAWFLANDLNRLLFYPEAFAVLVLGKTHSIAKSALVPRLSPNPERLVANNAHLSRTGSLAGAAAGAAAAAALQLIGAGGLLRVAAIVYAGTAFAALGLPRSRPAPPQSVDVDLQLHRPSLRLAAIAMATLRCGVGLFVFHIAFTFRSANEPVWLFGAVLLSGGLGGLLGTVISPLLRRRATEPAILMAGLVSAASAALVAAWRGNRLSILLVALTVGIAANAGRHAFDSVVQREAPTAHRGRAFARFETMFQLAWVGGALIPVAARPPGWAGHLVLAVALAGGALFYAASLNGLRELNGRTGHPPPTAALDPGPSLLEAAHESMEVGAYRTAVVFAHASACATSHAGPPASLLASWRAALTEDQVTYAHARAAIDAATLVAEARPPASVRPTPSTASSGAASDAGRTATHGGTAT